MSDTRNECQIPKGTLLIIGGKEDKGDKDDKKDGPDDRKAPAGFFPQEILKRFVELTSKNGPRIEVVTTGSSEGEEMFEEYRKAFSELGVNKPGHIHHKSREEVLSEEVLERVTGADGLFLTGGDQLLLTSLYGGTPFLTELKNRYIFEKIVIAGTSAGAMAMSTPMIYAGSEEVQQIGGEIKVTTGLEFLKDVCIDTHFVHRSRFIRLAQVIATNPTSIGLGIEEDTAVVVTNGLEAEVIGSGTVILIKGFMMTDANMEAFQNKQPVSIRNLAIDILAKDDRFTFPQVNPPHY